MFDNNWIIPLLISRIDKITIDEISEVFLELLNIHLNKSDSDVQRFFEDIRDFKINSEINNIKLYSEKK